MLLLKPIKRLLNYNFFSGFEDDESKRLNYAFFGCVKNHRFLELMLDFYSNNEFDEFNPPIITHTFKNLINSGSITEHEILFKREYFYPLTYQNRKKDYKLFINKESYAVHLWEHSWKLETKKGYDFIFSKFKIIFLDYIQYRYSFEYFKKYTKQSVKDLYRKLKYNDF